MPVARSGPPFSIHNTQGATGDADGEGSRSLTLHSDIGDISSSMPPDTHTGTQRPASPGPDQARAEHSTLVEA